MRFSLTNEPIRKVQRWRPFTWWSVYSVAQRQSNTQADACGRVGKFHLKIKIPSSQKKRTNGGLDVSNELKGHTAGELLLSEGD
jgi:hypothetical protein